MTTNNPILDPGRYSVFVLSDDGTWEQPTFRIEEAMSEGEFRTMAELECSGFISYGVQEDTDCPDEHVRTFTDPDHEGPLTAPDAFEGGFCDSC